VIFFKDVLFGNTKPLYFASFRLKNEITRLTAVKALIRIASSELKINLRPILADSLPILAGFLRKNQRALKLSSLALLDILVKNNI
jgi:cullin-associated NEDD8-dissociated protein 1